MLGIPFWLTDLVLADRFDVGVGGGGKKLGGPEAIARYLWRSAGDASAGWWPVTLAAVLGAAAGVVLLRREARALVLCLVGVAVAAFVLARMGGSASPESRHLIFLAPLFAIALATSIVRVGRRAPLLAVVAVTALVVVDVAWAWHRTPPLFEWEPDARQAARAEAETLARGDEPPRRRALRLRAALPRRVGAEPLLPDDRRPACRSAPCAADDRARGPARARRLGARRERAEQHPSATRDRLPAADTRGGRSRRGLSGRSS